jgi:cardiolipin synthase A/B
MKPKYRYPWRDGNLFGLLIDGGQFFPPMQEAIAGAQDYVLLEMYLVESGTVADRFIALLTQAAARGVRVYALFDDFGALGLQRKDRLALSEAGVHLGWYNPVRYRKLRRNLVRDHRKLLVVDGEVAYTGGMGLTDEFDPPDATSAWRETGLEVRGPCVGDWQQVFAETWRRSSDVPLPRLRSAAPAGDQRGRVVTTQLRPPQEIKRSFMLWVRQAERRVWLATAYFVPSWKLRRALRHAAQRGLDVRMLVPGPHTDHPAVRHAGQRFFARLLRNGVRIYEYQPRFTHSKVMLCDGRVSIGSSNVDRWNLRWNLEANQEIDDERIAAQVGAMFEGDFADSLELRYEDWVQRPWRRRLLEQFWGTVDVWLERLNESKWPRIGAWLGQRLHRKRPGKG